MFGIVVTVLHKIKHEPVTNRIHLGGVQEQYENTWFKDISLKWVIKKHITSAYQAKKRKSGPKIHNGWHNMEFTSLQRQNNTE